MVFCVAEYFLCFFFARSLLLPVAVAVAISIADAAAVFLVKRLFKP